MINLFLFSLLVLSIWMNKFSDRSCRWLQVTRVLSNSVTVKLLSCGNWRRSTNANACFPWGALVWTKIPVTWVRRCHKPLVDLATCFVLGRLVFAWSIPSMIMHMYFSGDERALSRWLWYFLRSFLLCKKIINCEFTLLLHAINYTIILIPCSIST